MTRLVDAFDEICGTDAENQAKPVGSVLDSFSPLVCDQDYSTTAVDGGINALAILDENGDPILDENGNQILYGS